MNIVGLFKQGEPLMVQTLTLQHNDTYALGTNIRGLGIGGGAQDESCGAIPPPKRGVVHASLRMVIDRCSLETDGWAWG